MHTSRVTAMCLTVNGDVPQGKRYAHSSLQRRKFLKRDFLVEIEQEVCEIIIQIGGTLIELNFPHVYDFTNKRSMD